MKRTTKKVSLLGLGMMAVMSWVTTSWADTGYQQIESIWISSDGNAIVSVDGSFSAGSCTSTTNYRIDDVNGDTAAQYKTVLAAFLAGKEIKATFTGACTPGMNIADRIYIR